MQVFLNHCQRIELIAEKIYRAFAENDLYPQELRGAFFKLSSDESDHARQIDVLLRTEIDEAEVSPQLSGNRLGDILLTADKLLDDATRKNLTEEGALKRALKMEQEFLTVHVHNAVHFSNQRLADFFQHLGREDQEHIAYLKKVLAWWHSARQPKYAIE